MRRTVKPSASTAFWACAFFAVAGLGLRLLWLAAQTETGFSQLAFQWCDASWGQVAGRYQPVYMRTATEQADYWLAETDRILQDHPNNAELKVGAALILFSPSEAFTNRHLKQPSRWGGFLTYDSHDAKADELQFRFKTQATAAMLLKEATEIEPEQMTWWQLRALLTVFPSPFRLDDEPLSESQFALLEECSRHDPDNALYAYLAANGCWQDVWEWDRALGKDVLVSPEKLERFVEYCSLAQQKPSLVLGHEGCHAIASFLDLTRVPVWERDQTLRARGGHWQRDFLLLRMLQNYRMQANNAEASGDDAEAMRWQAECDVMLRQSGNQPLYSFLSIHIAMLSARCGEEHLVLAVEHPDRVSPEDLLKIETAYADYKLASQVGLESIERFDPYGRKYLETALTLDSPASTLTDYLVTILPWVICSGLLVSTVVTGLSRWNPDVSEPRLGRVAVFLTAAVCLSLTLMVLGLAAALMWVRFGVAWILPSLVVALPILLLIGLAVIRWRYHQGRFGLRLVLLAFLLFGLQIAVAKSLMNDSDWFFDFIGAVEIQPTGPDTMQWILKYSALPIFGMSSSFPSGLSAMPLPNQIVLALSQWILYSGPIVTLALWLLWLGGLLCRRTLKLRKDPAARSISSKEFVGRLSVSVQRPLWIASLMVSFVYLWLVPGQLRRSEALYQQQMAYARDPAVYWEHSAQGQREVESDEAWMKLTRQVIEQEIQSIKQQAATAP